MRALLTRVLLVLLVGAFLGPAAAQGQSSDQEQEEAPPRSDLGASETDSAPAEPLGSAGGFAGITPILEAVEFPQRVYFRDETLRSFMLHPVPGEIDEALLRADAERIRDRYRDRGYLQASVTLRVLPGTPPRGLRAQLVIDAGERAELKRVKVVGNVLVEEAALKEGFFSQPPWPLGFLMRAGFFHRPFLDQDAQRLIANYYKRGFLEARVIDTRVEANPTLDGLSATFRVVEGPLYELGRLVFEGDLPPDVSVEAMRAQIDVKDGETADLVTIQQQADALLEPWREAGHPFARFEQSVQVMPPPSGNPDHRAVALTLRFVKGPKPVVRAVRVAGNKGTQDRVILRDVAVVAGEPYDHQAMKKTERALMRTSFFSAVQARPVPTEDPDVIDVEIAVTEQQTWLASIAPAFDTTRGGEGLIGVGILADRNFLGTGLYTSLFARVSGLRQAFDFTVSEPRLLDTFATLTGEVHRREISYFDFRVRSDLGGGARVSVPVGGGVFLGGGFGVEHGGVVLYEAGDPLESPKLVLNEAGDHGLLPSGVFRNTITASVAWDRRDNLLLPRNGVFASASTTYAGPLTLSGSAFLDTDASLKLFWTPLWGITLKSNTQAAFVFNPHGGVVPVTDRYFLGGLGSVRGFPVLSLGPIIDVPTTDGGSVPLRAGGVMRLVQNLELEFPLVPNFPLRGFVFLDAGNAFGEDELDGLMQGDNVDRGTPLPLAMFYSTGFGLLIETPVAPLRFEWSVPLTRRPEVDAPINFFFGIGSAF